MEYYMLLFFLIFTLFTGKNEYISSGSENETQVIQTDTTRPFSATHFHWTIERSPIAVVDSVWNIYLHSGYYPTTGNNCEDGTYAGSSPYDDFDFKHVARITIEKGKIVDVAYDEIRKNGKGKENDKKYCQKMSVTGTSPEIAYPIYRKQLLEKQNLDEIDAVSGATYSLYRFRMAVGEALRDACLKKD